VVLQNLEHIVVTHIWILEKKHQQKARTKRSVSFACADGFSLSRLHARAAAKPANTLRHYAGCRKCPRQSLRRLRTRGGQPRAAPLASIIAPVVLTKQSFVWAGGDRRG